jgi:hypothetical protein
VCVLFKVFLMVGWVGVDVVTIVCHKINWLGEKNNCTYFFDGGGENHEKKKTRYKICVSLFIYIICVRKIVLYIQNMVKKNFFKGSKNIYIYTHIKKTPLDDIRLENGQIGLFLKSYSKE